MRLPACDCVCPGSDVSVVGPSGVLSRCLCGGLCGFEICVDFIVRSWQGRLVNAAECPVSQIKFTAHLHMDRSTLDCNRGSKGSVVARLACAEIARCAGLPHAAGLIPRVTPASQSRIIQAHRLAISFIVRDGARFLSVNIAHLVRLGRRFREHRLFYVENDSTDGTRAVLRRLSRVYPQLQGLMLDGLGNESHALCPARLEEMNCERRLALLAYLRQRALSLVEASWTRWTALLSVDVDFLHFSADQFISAFVTGVLHNASAIFGMSITASSTTNSGVQPYDTAAIRPLQAQATITRLCLTKVESAFSGFGTYFARSLRWVRPTYLPRYDWNRSPHAAAATEHNCFNAKLHAACRDAGCPLLVDPRFQPKYEWGDAHFLERVAARVRRRGP